MGTFGNWPSAVPLAKETYSTCTDTEKTCQTSDQTINLRLLGWLRIHNRALHKSGARDA